MNKKTILGLTMASALAFGTVAVAAPAGTGGWHGHHGGHHGRMMFNKLNLSDAQRASIKQIVSSSREQNKPARQALRKQRAAFEAMTPNQTGYQAAAIQLAQVEGQATQERVERMAKQRGQIYAVLTPAQQAQAAALKVKAQARRQQWQQFKTQNPLPSAR